MRLGTKRTMLKGEDCITAKLYKGSNVDERHRHRYEVPPPSLQPASPSRGRVLGAYMAAVLVVLQAPGTLNPKRSTLNPLNQVNFLLSSFLLSGLELSDTQSL